MKSLLKKTSAWLPIAMSIAAFTLTTVHVTLFGVNRAPHDEGTPAHLFQILMAFQLPIIGFFVLKWLPEKPKEAIKILAIQIVAIIINFSLIYFLEL